MELMKKRIQQRGQGGFTLIELLVVIAILAILAGVVVFAVGNSTDNAKVSSCKTEYAAVKTAIAAARTANEANTTAEDPGDYLEAGNANYFDWAAGGSDWIVTIASGAPAALVSTANATACNVLDA